MAVSPTDDIALLAEVFLAELAPRLGKQVDGISDEAMEALLSYRWPGNVRELRNVIERGILVATSDELRPADLPFAPSEATDALAPTLNLRESLASSERQLLLQALRQAKGVRRAAAGLLGIDERNLSYYLKKHDLMDRG